MRCPECASTEVSYSSNGFWWKTLTTLVFLVVLIGSCSNTNQRTIVANNEEQKTLPLQSQNAGKLLDQQLESNKTMKNPSLDFKLN